jgi:small subunit ribosomal protein S8e
MVKAIENLAKREITGGRRIPYRGRRVHHKKGYAAETVLGKELSVTPKTRSRVAKISLRTAQFANVINPQNMQSTKVQIQRVLENPANKDYQRRGVITKGAIIETEQGKARVTSRPGQHGVINAVPLGET